MKWVALAVLLALIPPLSQWLRQRPEKIVWVCFALGLLPYIVEDLHLFVAPVSWPGWAGYTTGTEITLEDFFALVLFLSIQKSNSKIPLLAPMALYILATLIASANALYTTAALFYCWQLLRVCFIYSVVFIVVTANFASARALLIGMACGELVELVVASYQRFGMGVLQTHGTLGSQNELGLVSHFVMFPFFAIMLGGRRGWLPAVVVLAGLVVETLTTSRGTILLGVAGMALVYALSSLSKWNSRKALIALGGLVVLAAATPFALASFEQRFSGTGDSLGLAEDAERVAYKAAAAMIVEDFPGGVGPNHFTIVADLDGYFIRAGEAPYARGLAGRVHNVYWLVLAETGYLGLITYLGFLLFPLALALRYGVGGQREADRDLLLGLGVTLIIVYIHSWEEWVPIAYTLQTFLAINFGLIAALAAKYRQPQASASASAVMSSPIFQPPIYGADR